MESLGRKQKVHASRGCGILSDGADKGSSWPHCCYRNPHITIITTGGQNPGPSVPEPPGHRASSRVWRPATSPS